MKYLLNRHVIVVPVETHAKLAAFARERGMTISGALEHIMRGPLDKYAERTVDDPAAKLKAIEAAEETAMNNPCRRDRCRRMGVHEAHEDA